MNTPIHSFLEEYSAKNPVRCHMPGGKGRNSPFDITEIHGADSLFESDGIIYESEKNAASLFGAGATLFSCGGSTLAIQGMLGALRASTEKNTVIAGRYCHKSLVNACILLGFKIKWVYPDEYLGTVIPPERIKAAFDEDTAAVFINSVDYYGGEADIAAVSSVCRKKNIPLLVDNAHGAYRVFTGNHPILLGADMCADSAHKTLPALTGAAYLHLKNPDLRACAKAAMNMFGSSSPSYLIMDSLDLCNSFISDRRETAMAAFSAVERLKKHLSESGFSLKKSDPMRITVNSAVYGFFGDEMADILRKNGAECEMSDEKYVVLLFSVCQRQSDFDRLYDIFKSIEKKPPVFIEEHKILRPKTATDLRRAYFSPRETIKTASARGRICGGVHTPCPPCVPLIMPGEVFDDDVISELIRFGVENADVIGED